MNKMTDSELVELAKADSESAKEELILRCKDVISYNVVKYKSMYWGNLNRFDIEDLVTECHIAVLEAINLYDSKRGASFATFSKFIIRTKLLDFLKNKIKQTRNISQDIKLERLAAPVDITRDLTITVKNERDREIVDLLLQGMRKTDIAKQFGLTRMAITLIIRKCIK